MIDFHRQITDWYRLNRRDLPWRETKNPYLIWLSEIILQQTRVVQGMDYYLKFCKHYPTVFDLANASEQEVLNDWQGLGYYSRARNLHATSKLIVENYQGEFPVSFDEIKKLKGIGDYTAAAISSFAFDLPHAVVDGNVYRVLSRVFDVDLPIDSTVGKKYFADLAQQLLPIQSAAIHNQSIMEFGAIQCVPVSPNCTECPINHMCLAKANQTIGNRPVKEKKIKVRERFFHFLVCDNEGKTVVEKRNEKDIWQHLYQFPMIETERMLSFEEMKPFFASKYDLVPFDYSETVTHILSHQKISAVFYRAKSSPEQLAADQLLIPKGEIQNFPLPRLIDRYLEINEL